MALNPKFDYAGFENKFLYYPCAGNDFIDPIITFRDFISTFWFVDKDYFLVGNPENDEVVPLIIPDFKYIRSEIIGPKTTGVETRKTLSRNKFKFIEPGVRKDYYKYQNRTISINRRRGFDFNSLFGPTTMPIGIENLGVFFYRGDSCEWGTSHLWMSTHKVKMLRDHERISLLSMVIDALPNNGFLATDGSNHLIPTQGKIFHEDEEFNELFKNYRKEITCDEAIKQAKIFTDSLGNSFNCVGHAGMKYGPTLIWQITKST